MPSCRPDFHTIRSYAEANDFLAKAKPFPETKGKDETFPRRLEATRKRHMNIRLLVPHEIEKVYVETFGEKGYYNRNGTEQSRLNLAAHKGKRHIALRLYSTDVVVWREDEAIFLDPYVSNSTNAFVDMCTPHGLRTDWGQHACLVSCFTGEREHYKWSSSPEDTYPTFDRYYRVASGARAAFQAREDGYWWPLGGIEPWNSIQVDRKASRAALRAHGWHDFELWAIGYCTMTKRDYRDKANRMYRRIETREILEAFKDRQKWPELVEMSGFWPNMPESYHRHGFASMYREKMANKMAHDPIYINKLHARRLAERVKLAIYDQEGCVTTCNRDFLPSYGAVKSHFASHEKYEWRN